MRRLCLLLAAIVIFSAIGLPSVEASYETVPDGSTYEYVKYGAAHPYYHCEITKAETVGDTVHIPAALEGYEVTVISECAFFGCGMSAVIIPVTVTEIRQDAFKSCDNLKDVFFMGEHPTITGAFGASVRFHVMPGD